jgi:HK97 family phage major capsid protein
MPKIFFSESDTKLSDSEWTRKLEAFVLQQQSESATRTVSRSVGGNASKADVLAALEPILQNAEADRRLGNFQTLMAGQGTYARSRRDVLLRTACESVLRENPKARAWLRSAAVVMCRLSRSGWSPDDVEFARSMKQRSLTTGDGGLGQALSVDEGVSEIVYSLLNRFSIFRTLNVIPLDGGKRKIARVTGKANAAWITAANQGTALPTDSAITGDSVSAEVATVGTIVEVSGEALADGKTTFEGALLVAIVGGLGYRLDWTCFQGSGDDDTASAAMTGLFVDPNVPAFVSDRTAVASLRFDDFADTIGKVTSSALQHACAWWINPIFLPALLKIRDGEGGPRLLKPPTGPDDQFTIHGFPVFLAAAAPGTDEVNAKVAAFGRRDAYAVALRQDFEVASSPSAPKWVQNIYLFRALARARCVMLDAKSFATLQLASGE